MTKPNLKKVIVFGIDRRDNSGTINPSEPVLCELKGYTNEELDDFRKQYQAGSLPDYELRPLMYRIMSVSSIQPRLTMMRVQ